MPLHSAAQNHTVEYRTRQARVACVHCRLTTVFVGVKDARVDAGGPEDALVQIDVNFARKGWARGGRPDHELDVFDKAGDMSNSTREALRTRKRPLTALNLRGGQLQQRSRRRELRVEQQGRV